VRRYVAHLDAVSIKRRLVNVGRPIQDAVAVPSMGTLTEVEISLHDE
jgi:hypothetical protein